LVSNAVTSAVTFAVYLPVSLLVNAYAVHKLGLAEFGIWATLTTVLGLGELLDLGVSAPLVKYVAESSARGEQSEVNAFLGTGMVIYLATGLIFVASMLLASGWILIHLFHVPAGDNATRLLFITVVVGFAFTLTCSVLQSLLIGLQRADLVSRLMLGYNLLGAAATIAVLWLGLGVNGLVIAWAGTTVVQAAGNWIAARRLFPGLSLNPFLFRRAHVRQILRFSAKIQGSVFTSAVNDLLDRFLISYALGPVLLGSYALALRGAQAVRGLSYSVASGLLPAAADLHALGQTERLRELYIRATRYLAIFDIAVCLCLAALARPLVHAWLGAHHDRVAVTLIVMLASFTIALPCQATSELLNGMGRPEVRLRADLILLPAHVTLAIVLIWQFGYYGTIAGTAIVYGLNRTYLLWAGARVARVPFSELLRRSLLPPATAGLLATAVGVTIQALNPPLTIPVLVGELAAFGLTYVGVLAVVFLDRYERDLITQRAAPLFNRCKRVMRPAGPNA
jgi:O-antigen/teichoic acid export membrane protein